mgnify:CR=1 FL=1
MYQDKNILESMKLVEAARAENVKLNPRRMTAEEKDQVLLENHPDHIASQFAELAIGPNKGEKVPLELAEMLQVRTRRLVGNMVVCVLGNSKRIKLFGKGRDVLL